MRRRAVWLSVLTLSALALASCIFVGNLQPVASFTGTPTTGTTPLDVQLDASASYDPDGTIALYSWDFGDGQTASTSIFPFSHMFTVQSFSRVFTVVLTVTDAKGADGTAVKNITVDP